MNAWALLNICTVRNGSWRFGRLGRQLHGDGNLALVAENAELHGFLVALAGQLFAQIAERADAFAIQRGDYVAALHASFFRWRAGVHFAHENALAIRRAKVRAELP